MRETEFIQQNKDKWQGFEHTLLQPNADPEELSRVFIESTDDLSFARTQYRNRSVRVYLNRQAQRIHQLIYKSKKDAAREGLWSRQIPVMSWHSRRQILISFVVFMLSIGIGLLSSHYDPEFPKIIMGEDYIAMSEANVEKGDPMAVYKDSEPVEMFLRIAWNNIRVSYLVFVMGVFFSIGTLFALISNGIMVGAFLSFFIQRDLLRESFLAIMLHGTLELSCIVLAGAAGLVLGSGLLFPGTYTRLQAFLISARKGILIMVAITPLLVIAALIEGFATRFTETPDAMRLAVILISLFIMLGYFIWLPYRLYKQGLAELPVEELHENKLREPRMDEVKNSSRVFTESFYFYRKMLPKLAPVAAVLGFLHMLAIGFSNDWDLGFVRSDYFLSSGDLFSYISQLLWFPDDVDFLFRPRMHPVLAFSLLISFTAVFVISLKVIQGSWFPSARFQKAKMIRIAALIAGLATLTLLLDRAYSILLLAMVLPLFLFFLAGAGVGLHQGLPLSEVTGVLSRSWLNVFGTFAIIAGFQFICLFLVNAPLSQLIFGFVLANLDKSWEITRSAPFFLYGWLAMTCILLILPLQIAAMSLLFSSGMEIKSARGLMERIGHLGTRKRSYGLERED